MDSIIKKACDKINSCTDRFNDKYAKAIAEPVKEALRGFCKQQEEFARAVLDGDVEQCILSAAKKISGKQSVSDLEVYQTAVEYYFPGAVIENKMTIHMSRYELTEDEPTAAQPETPKSIELSLDSLLDW